MELALGVSCIKGEIHSIITLLRLNTKWSSSKYNSRKNNISYSIFEEEDEFILSFRQLNEYLEGLFDLNEVNCSRYIKPFYNIIVSEKANGPLTSAALTSLCKFGLYGFFKSNYPGIDEAMYWLAKSVAHCVFEETDWETDELILMKLLELSVLTFRSEGSSFLTIESSWEIFCTCISIHGHYRASKILKIEAESSLLHLTLNIFTRANNISVEDKALLDILEWENSKPYQLSDKIGLKPFLLKIIKIFSDMIDITKNNTDTVKFGLVLLNVALEAGGPSLNNVRLLVEVLSNDVCRHLLRATQTEDLGTFSSILRVVFNLFMSIKDHMKVQLEVFLTSVHLRYLNNDLAPAREELALESLVEFCREPTLMQDIYLNYDCDVQCTNLFEIIVTSLCKRSYLTSPRNLTQDVETGDWLYSKQPTTNDESLGLKPSILNRLAFDGILAILKSLTNKTLIEIQEADEFNQVQQNEGILSQSMSVDPLDNDIDKWCDSNLEAEFTNIEEYEDFSLVKPIKDEQIPSNTQENSRSSPDESWLGSMSDTSSLNGSEKRESEPTFIDRENEFTSSIIRAKNSDTMRKKKMMKQRLTTISELFNSKPLKNDWLKLAIESDFVKISEFEMAETYILKSDPQSVAQFLKQTPSLGKTQIGEFISKGPANLFPYHALVLKEYVKTFDFSNGYSEFDKALRLFLSCFRLPGEAQCIDRIMEAFAGRFYEQLGPGKPFANSDAVFILAFSTIMLNTDLHNPQIAMNKKMTKEEFIRNNRGINDGKDLPREYLENIYNEIKSNQIQVDIDVHDPKAYVDFSDSATWNKLISKSINNQEPAKFTPTFTARNRHGKLHSHSLSSTTNSNLIYHLSHEGDMFLSMSKLVLEALIHLLEELSDDQMVIRANQAIYNFLLICKQMKFDLLLEQTIILFIKKNMFLMSKRRQTLFKPYSKGSVLSKISNYNSWKQETNGDLIALINSSFDQFLEIKSLTLEIKLKNDISLVKNEILFRFLFHFFFQIRDNLHTNSWSIIFELLVWARSRGSLPLSLSYLENQIYYDHFNEENNKWNSVTLNWKPSEHAKNCFRQAYGLLEKNGKQDSNLILNESDEKSNNWLFGGFLWSNNDNLNDKNIVSLRNNILDQRLFNYIEGDEIWNNLNASPTIDENYNHYRTDDWLLQQTLESCDLYSFIQHPLSASKSITATTSADPSQTDIMLHALIQVFLRNIEKLTKYKFDLHLFDTNVTATDSIVDFSYVTLGDSFPLDLLEGLTQGQYPVNELDLVGTLEWLTQMILSKVDVFENFQYVLYELFHQILTEESDLYSKHIPFVLERTILLTFRCLQDNISYKMCDTNKPKEIFNLSSVNLLQFTKQQKASLSIARKIQHTWQSWWKLMRYIKDLPSFILKEMAGNIGLGLLTLIRHAHSHKIPISKDQWEIYFNLLSTISSCGWEGYRKAWDVIAFLIYKDLITEFNYFFIRHVIQIYLDKNIIQGFKVHSEDISSMALLLYLRLTLMPLANYLQTSDIDTNSFIEDSPSKKFTKSFVENDILPLRSNDSDLYTFKISNFANHTMFNENPSQIKSSSNSSIHPTTYESFYINMSSKDPLPSNNLSNSSSIGNKNSVLAHFPSPPELPDTDIHHDVSFLTVPLISLNKREDVEALVLSSFRVFGELVTTMELSKIHHVLYCIETLISAGQIACWPIMIWQEILDLLFSKLPIDLAVQQSRFPDILKFHNFEIMNRSCNILFHLIVVNFREFRRINHFDVLYLRIMSTLLANINHSPKTHAFHEEMILMSVALFRLLRMPTFALTNIEQTQEGNSKRVHDSTKIQNSEPSLFSWLDPFSLLGSAQMQKQNSHNESNKQMNPIVSTIKSLPMTPKTFTIESQESTTHVKASETPDIFYQHDDRNLIQLTWMTALSVFPTYPAILRSRDPVFHQTVINVIQYLAKNPSETYTPSTKKSSPLENRILVVDQKQMTTESNSLEQLNIDTPTKYQNSNIEFIEKPLLENPNVIIQLSPLKSSELDIITTQPTGPIEIFRHNNQSGPSLASTNSNPLSPPVEISESNNELDIQNLPITQNSDSQLTKQIPAVQPPQRIKESSKSLPSSSSKQVYSIPKSSSSDSNIQIV